MFVSWCYNKAGAPLGNIGFPKGFAGCQTAAAFFLKNGLTVTDPQPGDIVLFDWNGDRRYDHTGIFVKKMTATHFETVEGNTSLTNQSNGGTVMRRTRAFKNVLFCRPRVLRP
jgi:cell wall-associated NlpC family hydrolase